MSTTTETITETAMAFFEACETGKGWEGCSPYCHPDAGFASQAEPLADMRTLEGYADWMKGLLVIVPDGSYVVKSFATDAERNNVCAYGVFSGTHTGEGGPCRRPARAPARTTFTSWSSRTADPPHDEDLERRLGDARARLDRVGPLSVQAKHLGAAATPFAQGGRARRRPPRCGSPARRSDRSQGLGCGWREARPGPERASDSV